MALTGWLSAEAVTSAGCTQTDLRGLGPVGGGWDGELETGGARRRRHVRQPVLAEPAGRLVLFGADPVEDPAWVSSPTPPPRRQGSAGRATGVRGSALRASSSRPWRPSSVRRTASGPDRLPSHIAAVARPAIPRQYPQGEVTHLALRGTAAGRPPHRQQGRDLGDDHSPATPTTAAPFCPERPSPTMWPWEDEQPHRTCSAGEIA